MVSAKNPRSLDSLLVLVPELIHHLGEDGYFLRILRWLEQCIEVRHISIVAFDGQLTPRVVAAESIGRSQIAKSASKIYSDTLLHRYDPNLGAIRRQNLNQSAPQSESATANSHRGGDDDGNISTHHDERPLLLRVKASEIKDIEYQSKIYRRFGLVDRFSILSHTNHTWRAINLFRDRRAGEFDAHEADLMEYLKDIVSALIAKHLDMVQPATPSAPQRPSVELFEKLVSSLDSRLTNRQIQVCARALFGMSNVAVGLDLGIRVPTVATLRKRAYATLKISGLNELFSLCLTLTAQGALEDLRRPQP
jgi:DNA-binding CsgD family transcriptional regulator